MNINHIRLFPLSKLKNAFIRTSGRRTHRTCPFGLYRGLTFDMELQSEAQIWCGLWERETHPYIRQAAQQSEWAVDVGAGHGELCLYLLKHSKTEQVYAIEPNTVATDVLRRNLCLNGEAGSSRITVLNKLVGTSRNHGYVSLDALELDWDKRGFIKIDVDGREGDVLDSGRSLLTHTDASLLVETHSRALEEDCIRRLRTLGYSCKIIRNAWWRVIVPEQRPIDHNRWLFAIKHPPTS